MKSQPPFTNELIHETSPYLLQHAHNPVNWQAWNPEVLDQARKEGRLLLISIGYAACHWCHVMEHECFEDIDVAEIMNAQFVNIKIDREERPDVDHIYMDALQMMTGSGGWPLNIVALPDGRPFWGATYVPKQDWIRVLAQLADLYTNDPKKVREYANNLSKGLHQINLIPEAKDRSDISREMLSGCVQKWTKVLDFELGGPRRAPKFMMPCNLQFFLHYASLTSEKEINSYLKITLDHMAYGGIYDHLGGGFSRYSVDPKWHIPHFEKMLYDNAQLISLYASAYGAFGTELYRDVVTETITFLQNELMSNEGGFYSSLDADSIDAHGSLKEGAYYVWTKDELETLLKEDFTIFQDYYNINDYGYWEEGNYVLIRNRSEEEIAKKHGISRTTLKKKIAESKLNLLRTRAQRNRPRLDDKILTSWNALMIKGLVEASRYLNKPEYLTMAIRCSDFLEKNVLKSKGGLFHNHKNGKSTIDGFLEDYATLIDAWLALYELTFKESWLFKAKKLAEYTIANFLDPESGLFFFTSIDQQVVVRRSFETTDNVIPSSNAIMGHCLHKLAAFFPTEDFKNQYMRMMQQMKENMLEHPQSYAKWLQLVLLKIYPSHEVVISGKLLKSNSAVFHKRFLPNIILAGAMEQSDLSLLKGRINPGESQIFVCNQGSCQLPVTNPEEALELLKTNET